MLHLPRDWNLHSVSPTIRGASLSTQWGALLRQSNPRCCACHAIGTSTRSVPSQASPLPHNGDLYSVSLIPNAAPATRLGPPRRLTCHTMGIFSLSVYVIPNAAPPTDWKLYSVSPIPGASPATQWGSLLRQPNPRCCACHAIGTPFRQSHPRRLIICHAMGTSTPPV